MMSRVTCHAAPHVIETEIEQFLDNFKYVTSLLNSEFAVFDCQQENVEQLQLSRNAAYLQGSEVNRLSWPESHDSYTTSASGPKHSLTSPSDHNRNSMTSSSIISTTTDVTSLIFDLDPPPSSSLTDPNYLDNDGNITGNSSVSLFEGSSTGSNLTVLDIIDSLQANFAFISGGRSRCYCHIITFPDNTAVAHKVVTDEHYKHLITYLTSIPPLHDADNGFVLIIDRRHNKWGSVKALLLRISDFFPAAIQKIYVLRPSSFIQKAFADVALKFLAEDFRLKILMLNSVEELHEWIDRDQLTADLGGTLQYNHHEWIQHRAALEKFSGSASEIAINLRQLCNRIQDTQFPNDVKQTELLIDEHDRALTEVRRHLDTVTQHGETLLMCFKTIRTSSVVQLQQPSTTSSLTDLEKTCTATYQDTIVTTSQLPLSRVGHVTAVERLLVQLDETASNFESFWTNHKSRLEQCRQLRHFEEQFKQIYLLLEQHLSTLNEMTEKVARTATEVDMFQNELHQFQLFAKGDFDRAKELYDCGEQFISSSHYAIDCISPKCFELKHICAEFDEVIKLRVNQLQLSRQVLLQTIQGAEEYLINEGCAVNKLASSLMFSKTQLVMKELIDTEKIYCEELGSIVKGYIEQLDSSTSKVPGDIKQSRHLLFGNLDQIYNFHVNVFLRDLEACHGDLCQLANCFTKRSIEFQLYSDYCLNMKSSEQLLKQVESSCQFLQVIIIRLLLLSFFLLHILYEDCQKKLSHRLPLSSYLLKPVQRLTKYQLLLKEILRYCDEDCEAYNSVQKASVVMNSVVKYVNDVMHQNSIIGYQGNFFELGRLLMQGSFSISMEQRWDKLRDLRFKPMTRHLFLYETALLFCKPKDQPNSTTSSYTYKNLLLTADIGLTETVKGDPKKFELWSPRRSEVYILQAIDIETKQLWLRELKTLLQNQFNELRDHHHSNGENASRSHSKESIESGVVLYHTSAENSTDFEYVSRSSQSNSLAFSEGDESTVVLQQQSMRRSETEPVTSLYYEQQEMLTSLKRSETEPVSAAGAAVSELSRSSTLDADV